MVCTVMATERGQIEQHWERLREEVQAAEDDRTAVQLLREFVDNVERKLQAEGNAPQQLIEHMQEALEQIAARHDAAFEEARREDTTGFIPIAEEM